MLSRDHTEEADLPPERRQCLGCCVVSILHDLDDQYHLEVWQWDPQWLQQWGRRQHHWHCSQGARWGGGDVRSCSGDICCWDACDQSSNYCPVPRPECLLIVQTEKYFIKAWTLCMLNNTFLFAVVNHALATKSIFKSAIQWSAVSSGNGYLEKHYDTFKQQLILLN